ncbi:MAG: competence/damage-inducible protein A [Spirochaetaceae bacterium]
MLSLLVIGDEILTGRVVEENLSYMIRHFSAAGYAPEEARIIRDRVEEIASAVSALAERYDYLVTTGGVGPTHDDVTYEGVAAAFGLPLERNPDMVRFLGRRHGGTLEPGVERMALLPEGAQVIENPENRWPVVRVRNCFILPGLPGALKEKVHRVVALLPQREALIHANVYLTADEASVALWLSALQKAEPSVLIGSYPIVRDRRYLTKVSITGSSAAEVKALQERVASWAEGEKWLDGVDEPRPIGDDE